MQVFLKIKQEQDLLHLRAQVWETSTDGFKGHFADTTKTLSLQATKHSSLLIGIFMIIGKWISSIKNRN